MFWQLENGLYRCMYFCDYCGHFKLFDLSDEFPDIFSNVQF